MKVYIAQIVYFVSFVCIVNVCLYCLICPYCLHCQYCQYFLNALYRKYMFLYCLVLCCIILTLNIGQVLKLGKSCEIWSKQTKTQANVKNQKYSRNTQTQQKNKKKQINSTQYKLYYTTIFNMLGRTDVTRRRIVCTSVHSLNSMHQCKQFE